MWTIAELRTRWADVVGSNIAAISWPWYVDDDGTLEIITDGYLDEDAIAVLVRIFENGLPEAVEGVHVTSIHARWKPDADISATFRVSNA